MRPSRSLLPLLVLAATLLPADAHAQFVRSDYFFTMSGSLSQPNDSFGEFAQSGSQFLGGVHRRMGEHLTLGLVMGASSWSGADIQSYHDIQLTMDMRVHTTKASSRVRPFMQLGVGSYQVVSEAEPVGSELQRTSESTMGLNYGGGVMFALGKNFWLGPVVTYHTAGPIPEVGTLTGKGDCKYISYGLELSLPMGQ